MDQVSHMGAEGLKPHYIAIYFSCYNNAVGDLSCLTVVHQTSGSASEEIERLVAASKGGVNQ